MCSDMLILMMHLLFVREELKCIIIGFRGMLIFIKEDYFLKRLCNFTIGASQTILQFSIICLLAIIWLITQIVSSCQSTLSVSALNSVFRLWIFNDIHNVLVKNSGTRENQGLVLERPKVEKLPKLNGFGKGKST
nr:hypothetical protein CFP56_24174 [Quercus suber]